jgi:hypothetical protein
MSKSIGAKNKTKQSKKPKYLDKNHPLNKFLRSIT